MPVDATRESIYPDQWPGPAVNLEVDYAGQAPTQTPLHPSLLLPSFPPGVFPFRLQHIPSLPIEAPFVYFLFYFALCTPSD